MFILKFLVFHKVHCLDRYYCHLYTLCVLNCFEYFCIFFFFAKNTLYLKLFCKKISHILECEHKLIHDKTIHLLTL